MSAATTLPPREQILAAVGELLRATVTAPGDPYLLRWGGLRTVDKHLDALIEIAQRLEGDDPATCLAEILENVCAHCSRQTAAGYCPLRYIESCMLYRHAIPIIHTIRHTIQAGIR